MLIWAGAVVVIIAISTLAGFFIAQGMDDDE